MKKLALPILLAILAASPAFAGDTNVGVGVNTSSAALASANPVTNVIPVTNVTSVTNSEAGAAAINGNVTGTLTNTNKIIGATGGAGGAANANSSSNGNTLQYTAGDQTNTQGQKQQQQQANVQDANTNAAANNAGQNSSQSITQNFQASRVLPNLPGLAYAQQRDVQLYGQQGGTANIAGMNLQAKLRFRPAKREVIVSDDVRIIFVSSPALEKYKYSKKQEKGNRIDFWQYIPADRDVLASATVSPAKSGENVDLNSELFALQNYLDANYDGLIAVSTNELLATTYGNKSKGSSGAISPSAALAATTNLVFGGGASGGSNNAEIWAEGRIGATFFIVDLSSLAPPVTLAAPPAPAHVRVSRPEINKFQPTKQNRM